MQKFVFFFLAFVMVTSCNLFNARPSGVLSKEEMVDLLVDIHLTEATFRVSNDSLSRLSDINYLQSCFTEVFQKYEITPEGFNKSIDYYIEHVEQLDEIYSEVISRLTELESTLQQPVHSGVDTSKTATPAQPNRGNQVADSVRRLQNQKIQVKTPVKK